MTRRASASASPATAAHDFVYLASQSPRRRQLLEQIGVRHELLLAGADEDAEALEVVQPGELPADYVQRVTLAKLAAAQHRLVLRGLPPAPIVCADTTVAIGRRILGKPADVADASAMLARLSGRTHRVLTAVAVAPVAAQGAPAGSAPAPAPPPMTALNVSQVRFAAIDADTIARYVAGGEPFGKAGAYAIQGAAAAWIDRITGSHSGIMGLPLFETARLLAQVGARIPSPPCKTS